MIYKEVDGKKIELTPEEEAAVLAEWEKNKPDQAAQLKQLVTDKRYELEVSGITLLGYPIATTRESQTKIHAAYTYAKETGQAIRWKFADGVFRTLDAAKIGKMYRAVADYVKELYEVEELKHQEIDTNGTTDLETGWPDKVR